MSKLGIGRSQIGGPLKRVFGRGTMHAQAATKPVQAHLKRNQNQQSLSRPDLIPLLSEVENMMAKLIGDGSLERYSTAQKAAVYHLGSGGQRMRARLVLHAAKSMKLGDHDAVALATAVELLHNASLVHDDIQDEATERRGQHSVWALFGTNIAICTGDLLLSAGSAALSTLTTIQKLPLLLRIMHKCVSTLIFGQCAEMGTSRAQPSFADYKSVAAAKSGALLSLPFELVFTVSERLDCICPAVDAANAFALGYQILDDISDIDNDITRFDNPLCANAVLVLRANGAGNDAERLAHEAGISHLNVAAKMADLLPNESGSLLKSMALKLCSQN